MKKQILFILEGTNKENIMPEVVLVRKLGLDAIAYINEDFDNIEQWHEYRKTIRQLKEFGEIQIFDIINGVGFCKT